MASSTVAAKIQKATITLAVANFLAGIAFLVGFFISKEWLFLVASSSMFVAFIGIIIFANKMKKKLADMDRN